MVQVTVVPCAQGRVASTAVIMTLLHAQTSDLHTRLETLIDFPSALLCRGRYRALLAALFGFYEPLEAALAAFPDWAACGLDLAARRHTPALVFDLEALGLSPAAVAALPRCTALPDLPLFATATGCLYVLEGATLGGQVISRQLAAHGLGLQSGGRFHAGYQGDTGRMWREFAHGMERLAGTWPDHYHHSAVAGARDTFLALEWWLRETLGRESGRISADEQHATL